MWPDQPYAEGRGSFLRPVPVPLGGPTDTPTLTVAVACEYLPYIRGALQQLLLQATWAISDPALLLLTQQRMANLIDLFRECSSSGGPWACPFTWASTPALSDGFTHVDESPFTPSFCGELADGFGWIATEMFTTAETPNYLTGVDIEKFFGSPITSTDVGFQYILNRGVWAGGPGDQNGMILTLGGSTVATNLVSASSDTDGFHEVHITGTHTWDHIRLVVRSGTDNSEGTGGTCSLPAWGHTDTTGPCSRT